MSINATQTWLRADPQAVPNKSVASVPAAAEDQSNAVKKDDGDDFSFWDLLDVVNPFQHIPIVNTIYRNITGDTIKPAIKIAGDGLFGGVVGLVAGLAGEVFSEVTGGKDPLEMAYATIAGDDDTETATALAANEDALVQMASADPAQVAQNAMLQSDNPAAPKQTASDNQPANQSALMQLASDLQSGGQASPVPNAVSAAQASEFVQSLQKATPFNAVMPQPAPQMMKPSLMNGVNGGMHAGSRKPAAAPVIEIRPSSAAGNAVTPAPANAEIADKMMQALDAYQKMNGATAKSLMPQTEASY